MSYFEIARKQLEIDEGVRSFPYTDSVGKLSIGIGRNLTDRGLSKDEVDLLFTNDLQEAEDIARALLPNFESLSDERQAVMLNMAFNLGKTRLSGFFKTLEAIREERFEDASKEMLNSKWAAQVGQRANRLAEKMRTG